MAVRTKSTHAVTKEPASKTVRVMPVEQEMHPPHTPDIESPTASKAARDIFTQHALFAARARENARPMRHTSHHTPFTPPYRLFNAHASFNTGRLPLHFLFSLSLRTYLLLIIFMSGTSIVIATLFTTGSPVASTVENVRTLVVGIADEEPIIYNVTDPQKIAGQGPLFKRLITGDTILHYRSAELIVFYRSSEEKIIAVMSTVE